MRFRKGPVIRVIFFILLLTIVYSSPLNSFISTTRPDTIPEPAFDTSAIPTQQKGDDESDIHNGAEHGDKFADTYLFVFFIVGGAVLGRYIARKLKQPPVLGELLIGVIMGALLYQFQAPIITLIRHQDDVNQIIQNNLTNKETWEETIKSTLPKEAFSNNGYGQSLLDILESPEFPSIRITVEAIFLLSNIGVLLLLFLVGLETSMEEMAGVGFSSALVAFIGVVAPFGLGYIITMLLLPGLNTNIYLFVGATLCATSIGITARVFRDMGKLHIPEAKIVLGAAVIDDVLGLIILAVVAGIISSGTVSFVVIGTITMKAVAFLGITLFIGKKYLRHQIKFAALVEHRNIRLLFPFALLIFLAWLSDLIGLASIVGAFAAGLIIKEEYFMDVDGEKTDTVKRVMLPIETLFAPIFFVIMGLQVDLSTFLDINIIGIALLLTLVAIIGKIVSGIFIKSMDRNIIGIGMIPRGEVGLIFASIGKALGVLNSSLFSVIIIIVILTTFITPPALKWAFDSYDRRRAKLSNATS
jgi:Kef-type K+ transport system membrane component KefB